LPPVLESKRKRKEKKVNKNCFKNYFSLKIKERATANLLKNNGLWEKIKKSKKMKKKC